jgi:hypothetical protein
MFAKSQDTAMADASSIDEEDTNSETAWAPAWWRLDARLYVSAGQLSATRSDLVVHILDEAADVLCSETHRVASTSTQPSEPDPMILTWWAIERGEGTGECSGLVDWEDFPSIVYLGVGEMHPELEAVAGQVENLPEDGHLNLNGAYASVDSATEDTWVYGFAGDSAAWAGAAGPATVVPLSDGEWTLAGVYAFPLP